MVALSRRYTRLHGTGWELRPLTTGCVGGDRIGQYCEAPSRRRPRVGMVCFGISPACSLAEMANPVLHRPMALQLCMPSPARDGSAAQ